MNVSANRFGRKQEVDTPHNTIQYNTNKINSVLLGVVVGVWEVAVRV